MTMRRAFTLTLILAALAACSTPQTASTATPSLPPPTTIFVFPSATPEIPPATFTPTSTVVPTVGLATIPPATTQAVNCPAVTSVSGSHGVVLVRPEDVLNIRSAPGAANSIVGTYASNEVMIAVTGATAAVDGATWVQVCDSNGMVGWVNGTYLTEFVLSGQFCEDERITTLLDNLQTAFATRNGDLLAAVVSPTHGVDVWLWNSGNAINFDREHAHWVFESTYVHNWGAHPASGMETFGSFNEAVLPELQDAFVPSAKRRCNDGEISSYSNTWPSTYANINFYQVYRPGTPGVEMDWNAWLVGVEYVSGNPYVFSLIHFIWTP